MLAAGQLRGNSTSFVEQHRIRAYEVGPDQCATIVTVANLLQVSMPSNLSHERMSQLTSPCHILCASIGRQATDLWVLFEYSSRGIGALLR